MDKLVLNQGQVKLAVRDISIEAEGKNAELLVSCFCIFLLCLGAAAVMRAA